MLPMLEVALGLLALAPIAGARSAATFAYRAAATPVVRHGPARLRALRGAKRKTHAGGARRNVIGGMVIIGTALGAAVSGGGAFWWFPVAALGSVV